MRTVFQDSRGYLWFGTDAGACRYDGHAFRTFLLPGGERTKVYDVREHRDGSLWFATYDHGFMRLGSRDTALTAMDFGEEGLRHAAATVMYEDPEGNIWLGTDSGLRVIMKSGTVHRYRDELGTGFGEIYGIVRDHDGNPWIATHAGLLRCTWSKDGRLAAVNVLNLPVRSLILLANGDILAGTSGGGNDRFGIVNRYHNGIPTVVVSHNTDNSLIKAQCLCEDRAGSLWIGTEYGMYIVRKAGTVHLRSENGLIHENINAMLQDREGTMWFGTENGVMKLTVPHFQNYSLKDGLTGYVATAMLQDSRGNIWLGMWNGLNRIEPNGRITRWDERDGLVHHSVFALAEDERGRIWIGTERGANILSGETIDRRALCRGDRISGLCRGSDGTMRLGGIGTIYTARGGTIREALDAKDGVPADFIGPMFMDPEGTLWFGAGESGAGYIRDRSLRILTRTDGLPSDTVNDMRRRGDGSLWIASAKGIVQWHGHGLSPVPTLSESMKDEPVRCIAWDSSGCAWIGTDDGVFRWDGRRLQQYTMIDGLAADITSHTLVDKTGAVWFGTSGGVSRLDLHGESSAVPVPKVYIEGLTAGAESHAAGEEIRIGYDDRSITIRFNALSFVNERTVTFEWMLAGGDTHWQGPHKERYVRFIKLEPGSYTFSVRAANRNGAWSKPVTCSFTVLPPVWRSWWFLTLTALTLISVLALAYRYRVQQLLRIERLRTRIAADLHDDIASSLASVALYSDVIERKLEANDENRPLLGRIRNLSHEVMENIGVIVWSVDPRQDALPDVFGYFQRHGQQLCTAAGVAFTARLPEKIRAVTLSPEQRRTLYLIFKEGLNNCLRHAQCTEVSFMCVVRDREIVFSLRDNGKGFDPEAQVRGHGVGNMHARAESIGACLEIASRPDAGSELRLRISMT